MIKEFKTPSGPKTMLLGFESVKVLARAQDSGETGIDMIESVALSGFNTHEKRNKLDLTTREEIIEWFDDTDLFLDVKEVVEEFAENFTQKVSSREKAKPKTKK